MASAYKDENGVSTMIGVSNSNGSTITRMQANPVTHYLKVNDGTTGSDFGTKNAKHDDNDVPALMAVGTIDGQTPITLYVDSNGALLIQST